MPEQVLPERLPQNWVLTRPTEDCGLGDWPQRESNGAIESDVLPGRTRLV